MIKEFTDLKVWQVCKELTVSVYKLTSVFPKDEQYSLVSQIRRASISAAANIAEGFGRSTPKDQEHFYIMALGSLTELKSHMLIAEGVGLINQAQLEGIITQQTQAAQLLQGLLRSHRSRLTCHRGSSIKNRVST